jgi:spore germination protein GerM
MKNLFKRLLPALLAMLLLLGCAAKPKKTPVNPIDFYYCRRQAQYGGDTGALACETVDLGKKDISIGDILKLYFSGPVSKELISPFPTGLSCKSAEMDGGTAHLYLSDEYSTLTGVRLTTASACLTMTLSQISFVKKVQIRTDAGTLSEQGGESFSAADFFLKDDSAVNPEQTVTLYFADLKSGKLGAEKRTVSYTDAAKLPELALKELFAGPSKQGLSQAIPRGTELIDVSVSGSQATVVVSETFADCDTGTVSAELAVRSIAATLCALEGIDQVKISILNGQNLKYCDIQSPLAPSESWYG